MNDKIKHTEDLYNQLLKDYDELLQENEELKKNQRYHKKGVFTLEYDKETLRDMVDELQERIEKAVEYLKSKEDSLFMTFSDDMLDHDELIDKKIGTTLLNILNGRSDE